MLKFEPRNWYVFPTNQVHLYFIFFNPITSVFLLGNVELHFAFLRDLIWKSLPFIDVFRYHLHCTWLLIWFYLGIKLFGFYLFRLMFILPSFPLNFFIISFSLLCWLQAIFVFVVRITLEFYSIYIYLITPLILKIFYYFVYIMKTFQCYSFLSCLLLCYVSHEFYLLYIP